MRFGARFTGSTLSVGPSSPPLVSRREPKRRPSPAGWPRSRSSMATNSSTLLIEHTIGVRKRTLEVLTVEPDAIADLEGGD